MARSSQEVFILVGVGWLFEFNTQSRYVRDRTYIALLLRHSPTQDGIDDNSSCQPANASPANTSTAAWPEQHHRLPEVCLPIHARLYDLTLKSARYVTWCRIAGAYRPVDLSIIVGRLEELLSVALVAWAERVEVLVFVGFVDGHISVSFRACACGGWRGGILWRGWGGVRLAPDEELVAAWRG